MMLKTTNINNIKKGIQNKITNKLQKLQIKQYEYHNSINNKGMSRTTDIIVRRKRSIMKTTTMAARTSSSMTTIIITITIQNNHYNCNNNDENINIKLNHLQ